MSIKDIYCSLEISIRMNENCDNLDYFGFTDLIRKKLNEEELNHKIKQVHEVTNCNEELSIITLHDCNYNVEYAINKILTHEKSNEYEWKTKKCKQRKIPTKEKDIDKLKEIEKGKSLITLDRVLENDLDVDKQISSIRKYFNTNGKTFKNFNLHKKSSSFNYIDIDSNNLASRPEISFLIDGKWNEKSIIIENTNITPMIVKDMMRLKRVKSISCERDMFACTTDKKEPGEESIVFKTHCTTKPPPKILCSLASPVQIINKSVKNNFLPKLKFGDTDFSEDFKVSNKTLNSDFRQNQIRSESKFIGIDDNSIIKVGSPEKTSAVIHSCDQSEIFNVSSQFFKFMTNINKPINLIKRPNDVAEYSYTNVIQHNPASNFSNLPLINSLSSCLSSKEFANHLNPQDIFLNHSSSIGFNPQSNVTHGKSTIYLIPNMMMNPMNGLYMSVKNQIPTRTLSPPLVTIQSQYKMAQHPSQVYFDESLQLDDLANKNLLAMRQQHQFNQNFPKYKNPGDMVSEDLAIKSDFPKTIPNIKSATLSNLTLNQNAFPKPQIPFNYHHIYFSPSSVTSQNYNHSPMFTKHSINPNSINHHLQISQESHNVNGIRN